MSFSYLQDDRFFFCFYPYIHRVTASPPSFPPSPKDLIGEPTQDADRQHDTQASSASSYIVQEEFDPALYILCVRVSVCCNKVTFLTLY